MVQCDLNHLAFGVVVVGGVVKVIIEHGENAWRNLSEIVAMVPQARDSIAVCIEEGEIAKLSARPNYVARCLVDLVECVRMPSIKIDDAVIIVPHKSVRMCEIHNSLSVERACKIERICLA